MSFKLISNNLVCFSIDAFKQNKELVTSKTNQGKISRMIIGFSAKISYNLNNWRQFELHSVLVTLI